MPTCVHVYVYVYVYDVYVCVCVCVRVRAWKCNLCMCVCMCAPRPSLRRRAGGRADDTLERRHAHVRHGAHLGDPVRSLHARLLGRWLRRVVTAGRIAFGRIAASGSTGVAARLTSQRDWLP